MYTWWLPLVSAMAHILMASSHGSMASSPDALPLEGCRLIQNAADVE